MKSKKIEKQKADFVKKISSVIVFFATDTTIFGLAKLCLSCVTFLKRRWRCMLLT